MADRIRFHQDEHVDPAITNDLGLFIDVASGCVPKHRGRASGAAHQLLNVRNDNC